MARDLEGVKPGDKIKVRHSWGRGFDVHVVERVTKTQAVCANEKFNIDSGLMIGSGTFRNPRYASFATDEDFALAVLDKRIREAQVSVDRIKINESNLEAAEAFIAASQPKAEK
jgi:hypothetical protein